jgi:hypothetical protein
MANKQIKNFNEKTSPADTDLFLLQDGSTDAYKKVTGSNLKNYSRTAALVNTTVNFVASGCVWTGDAYASTLNASMTSGVVYINGVRLTVSAITAHAFTASKDTYVDLYDNGDGTAGVQYNAVANNAASPALTTNYMRIAIIVSGATNIASAGSVNQGQPDKVLPISSSIPYTTTDSLGNLIYNTSPNPRVLGYRQITTTFTTTSTSSTQVTGLSCPVIIPSGRKAKISAFTLAQSNSAFNIASNSYIWDGTVGSGTKLAQCNFTNGSASTATSIYTVGYLEAIVQPSLSSNSSKTYNVGLQTSDGAKSVGWNCSSDSPAYIKVELM